MDLWWSLAGSSRIRMTSADMENSLRMISARFRLDHIERISDLELEFSVSRRDTSAVLAGIEKNGDSARVLSVSGGVSTIGKWRKQPVLAGVLVILVLISVIVPTRIWFVQVEGNQIVPTRAILEAAEQCGLRFGVSRVTLRSEQVKNQLLEELPELSWVGVNTTGAVATITVRERSLVSEEEKLDFGSIVAARDGIVSEIIPSSGEVLCSPGQAVRAGDVLISGYTDLGICTRVIAAQGEVYGLTQRQIRAVLPEQTLCRSDETETTRYYSIIFGKKRINFYGNSGILDGTCGKMRMVYQVCLPGGWELPVYFVAETYDSAALQASSRTESNTQLLLQEDALRYLGTQMVAGQVLQEDGSFFVADGVCIWNSMYQCRELIGKRSSAVYLEGDGL